MVCCFFFFLQMALYVNNLKIEVLLKFRDMIKHLHVNIIICISPHNLAYCENNIRFLSFEVTVLDCIA